MNRAMKRDVARREYRRRNRLWNENTLTGRMELTPYSWRRAERKLDRWFRRARERMAGRRMK